MRDADTAILLGVRRGCHPQPCSVPFVDKGPLLRQPEPLMAGILAAHYRRGCGILATKVGGRGRRSGGDRRSVGGRAAVGGPGRPADVQYGT